MTGLNVLKKIWVKIWGEDIPPQQEIFENKNANLFKSFYTKIRNKLVFRRLAIVLFLLIATCLTFNYLKYTKFFACLGKDVCIYRGPKLASPKNPISLITDTTGYIKLKDGNIICLVIRPTDPYNYNYHKFISLFSILIPSKPMYYSSSIAEKKHYILNLLFENFLTFSDKNLYKFFGDNHKAESEYFDTKTNSFYKITNPVLPERTINLEYTTNSNSEIILYNIDLLVKNKEIKLNEKIIYNYKTQTQRTEPETIFNKINGEIIASKRINHNTNLYTIKGKDSSIKLYRHDTDKWTLTEVPNNLDLVLDLQKSIMLFNGNVAIASKHNSKPCSKTKICEPVVLYDVKSNKLIANNVEYKDFEDNLLHLAKPDGTEQFFVRHMHWGMIYNDNIGYAHVDMSDIDALLRKYTNSSIHDKPFVYAITPTKYLIWPSIIDIHSTLHFGEVKHPKEYKRTIFYDAENGIAKRGPDFIYLPKLGYDFEKLSSQISLDENKAISIGEVNYLYHENHESIYAYSIPHEYTQIIEVKK
ncbi:hypothetical protein IKU74_00185 [bacterium]|nr:hypothetical protein [bacterium]